MAADIDGGYLNSALYLNNVLAKSSGYFQVKFGQSQKVTIWNERSRLWMKEYHTLLIDFYSEYWNFNETRLLYEAMLEHHKSKFITFSPHFVLAMKVNN